MYGLTNFRCGRERGHCREEAVSGGSTVITVFT